MHDNHTALPGYHPDQLLVDGCRECEQRSRRADHGISDLDRVNFVRAWERAGIRYRYGISTVSLAELPMLDALWSVQIQFERLGWPVGTVPRG